MRNYIKVEVRLEGESNRDWKVHCKDGKVEKYYSIEGSPQRDGDDERVYDYDPQLAEWLEDMSYKAPCEPDEVCEFILDLTTGKLLDLKYEQVEFVE